MKKLGGISISIYFLIVIFTTHNLFAAPTLDQYFVPPSVGGGESIISDFDKAQTFTVGTSGTLSRVEIDIWRYPIGFYHTIDTPLLFDIRPTINGVPIEDDSRTLASVSIPVNYVPTTRSLVSVDISSFGIQVVPGDVLAIALRVNSGFNYYTAEEYAYGWFTDDLHPDNASSGYVQGSHFYRCTYPPCGSLPSGWNDIGNSGYGYNDLSFKTYVEATPIAPEPISSILFLIGGTLLAGKRFIRRQV